jgi:hypothetical protein
LVVFGDIDAFHHRRHAKDLRLERPMKVILQQRVEAGHLFGFAIRVGQRIVDEILRRGFVS